MTFIEAQLFWPRWHLGWQKHYDEEFNLTELFLFIGPLQMRFYI